MPLVKCSGTESTLNLTLDSVTAEVVSLSSSYTVEKIYACILCLVRKKQLEGARCLSATAS